MFCLRRDTAVVVVIVVGCIRPPLLAAVNLAWSSLAGDSGLLVRYGHPVVGLSAVLIRKTSHGFHIRLIDRILINTIEASAL